MTTRIVVVVAALFSVLLTAVKAPAFRVFDPTAGCEPVPACLEVSPEDALASCALKSLTITYWIDRDSIPDNLTLEQVRTAVRESVRDWEGIEKLIEPVRFVEASSAPDPLLDQSDSIVVITWNTSEDVTNDAFVNGDVAITSNTLCDPGTLEWPPGADIYLRATTAPFWPFKIPIKWVTSKIEDATLGTIYLPSVLAHEFGHVLALAHSEQKKATMFSQRNFSLPRWLKELILGVKLAKDDKDGLHFLYKKPDPNYLSFVEGDPGIPGDGLFINAIGGPDDSGSRDNLFEFSPLIPFDQFTDGFTFSIFAPLSIRDLEGLGFNIEILGSSCPRNGFGSGALVTGRTVVNGVKGTYANVPQYFIQSFVDFAKQISPGCDISISNLFLEGIRLVRRGAPLQPFTTLDAAAIGLGQNNFPMTRVP